MGSRGRFLHCTAAEDAGTHAAVREPGPGGPVQAQEAGG